MKKAISLTILLTTGCSVSERAFQKLQTAGLREVELKVGKIDNCPDKSGAKFAGTTKEGRKVSGTVCCAGPLRDCEMSYGVVLDAPK